MNDRTARLCIVLLHAAFLYAIYWQGKGEGPIGGLVRAFLGDPPKDGSESAAKNIPTDKVTANG